MKSFLLKVYCTDKALFEGDAVSLSVPLDDGLYGVMANHANTIAAIVKGNMKITRKDGGIIFAEVSEGMMKIEDNEVLVLLDNAKITDEVRAIK